MPPTYGDEWPETVRVPDHRLADGDAVDIGGVRIEAHDVVRGRATPTRVPAVAPEGEDAAMGGAEPYAYYGTDRSASPFRENRVTVGSQYGLMTFDALGAAPLLGSTPLLVVHGKVDAYCAPELAAELHSRATGEKRNVWLDCERHIDLYDVTPWVTQAVDATTGFLHEHCQPTG